MYSTRESTILCDQSKEVKGISTDRLRTIYESMTQDQVALEFLSIGVVRGISTVVQAPCEDPSSF